MNIYYNLRTDKQYRATTALSRKEFDELYCYFQKYYVPKPANPYPGTPQPVLTDRREALFFVLHYLKAYPTLECMGLYFGMSVQAVSDYLKRTKAYLRAALEEMDQMPPSLFASQQDFDQAFQGVDYLLIDATEVRVNRSKDDEGQRFTYSGKKKYHTWKTLVISDFGRVIHYVGRLWNGKTHDKCIYNYELSDLDYAGKGRLVDLGFHGLQADGEQDPVLMPWKKPRGEKLSQEDKEDNRFLASVRIRVEHAIGGMKRFFILRHTHRFHYNHTTYDAIQLCAALWNLKVAKH